MVHAILVDLELVEQVGLAQEEQAVGHVLLQEVQEVVAATLGQLEAVLVVPLLGELVVGLL